jgi:glycerophosphoryl diester phosphodiesterase
MTRKRLLKHTLLAASIVGVMLPPSIGPMRIGGPQEVGAEDRLIGRAVLPAASFAPGPTSGTLLGDEPINGQDVPFINKQPVQGFSAVLVDGNRTFLAMADNGFGSLENSADFHLRVYTMMGQSPRTLTSSAIS